MRKDLMATRILPPVRQFSNSPHYDCAICEVLQNLLRALAFLAGVVL